MEIAGILSLIFGALGTLSSYWYVGIVPCTAGLILGIIGMIDSYMDSKTSIIGLLLSVLGAVASVFFIVSDLDSGALALNAKRFGGEMISSTKDDDFMRFHQEGWTPEQAGTEGVKVGEQGESQQDEEEKIMPYWIKDSENTVQEGNTNAKSIKEEQDQPVVLPAEDKPHVPEEEKINAEQEENTEQEENSTGRWTIYRDGNVVISYDGMYRDDSFIGGYNVKLIVENLSDRTYTVTCTETSVNGYMANPLCAMEVAPGKKIADDMTIYGEDADRAPYGSVNSIETKFFIFESDNWTDSYETENIIIK